MIEEQRSGQGLHCQGNRRGSLASWETSPLPLFSHTKASKSVETKQKENFRGNKTKEKRVFLELGVPKKDGRKVKWSFSR